MKDSIRKTLEAQSVKLRSLADAATADAAWVAEVEQVHDSVKQVFGPLSHLNSVVSSPALRDAYNECLPLVTEFQTALGQNEALYRQFTALEQQLAGADGDAVLAELVRQNLRDFRLGGVALPGAAKEQFRSVMLELSSAQARFEQHLMDATDAFSHHVGDRSALAGLPESVVTRARSAAASEGLDGWLLKLDPPTFLAVQTHANDPALRELYYRAWVTRASELGPRPEEWDNSPLIESILALRATSAKLLGFGTFAELSLATKMAESPQQVIDFLEDLARRSGAAAAAERDELIAFAGRDLAAWDVAYYSEKLKNERFSLSDEELRAYFPLPKVLDGLFGLARRLFGLDLREVDVPTLWHETARFIRIFDADGNAVGGLLIDLYARPNKRGGAWMDGCRDRARLPALTQDPIAYLVCNFAPPGDDEPSYLTHNDVQTLFHEFGHALHHLLTEIDYPSIAGINGVAWDAVELPSQFFENYAWLPEVLTAISAHRVSGESIPDALIETLIASRSFLGALAMVRQLEFALFDFRLHTEPEPPDRERVRQLLDRARSEVGVWPVPPFNRFQCSFAHIFGGGYAAGYYSYKWAEVLAADAFAAFEAAGPFDAPTARRFRESILAIGGSRPAIEAFVRFRGREPELGPLLRQTGIA
jgi:oligopeptidase A